ncbi:MAG TPA: M43 family zinc metalloprotease [Blastocatellia bacterium]|nr:M43 family zinc metalloprotease [Blastocatellia bacterium]HMV86142.1 M43 family zinc metalloprotease [Blastocatellia bacterium]HMX25342.1 M43 family zinc metalloprotease [Blastocatellia bacterium]HMY71024.1 M43 family zinc metalloprotease [Blastocatellia bacterium]HMZ18164.1 M43 family zinc metalloprotease [Blastocatellia bacterium]
MTKTRILLLLVILLMSSDAAFGQYIEIRISVKVIVDPTTGARPDGITDNLFQTAADHANNWLATYSRGYRYRVTEVVDIGGPTQGGTHGPSKWFGLDPRSEPDWSAFQANTQNNSQYLLRSNQLNFYVSIGAVTNTGGKCPFPGESASACWGLVNDGPFWLVHESGHFFGLPHTFGGADCDHATSPGDDGIGDTLPEKDCWTQNQISQNAYGVSYDSLLPGDLRRTNVDNTFFNSMSYHNAEQKDLVEDRRTEMQLDREADIANSSRASVVSGKTRFVSHGIEASDSKDGLAHNAPKQTVLSAVNASSSGGGDIILLRPGHYNEQLTISKPVTLRATRDGSVTIGQP